MASDWMSYMILALALSLDSFTVGLVYALRGLRLGPGGLLVVSLTSMAVLGAAMLLGHGLASRLDPLLARRAGAALLMGVGVWVTVQTWICARRGRARPGGRSAGAAVAEPPLADPVRGAAAPTPVLRLRVPVLRLVVMIMREPITADLDRSGTINLTEALLLGLALAADSLAAGLGAGLAAFPPLVMAPLVGAASWGSLGLADKVAGRVSARVSARVRHRWGLVHGLALVVLGLYRIW